MKLETSVQKLTLEDNRRIIAVSDIHGHCSYLKKLLKKVKFSSKDELFLLGDYIERGLENIEALRYVMNLSKRPNVHALCGNMDAFTAQIIDGTSRLKPEEVLARIRHMEEKHGSCLISQMCLESDISLEAVSEIGKVMKQLSRLYCRELDFIYSLPTVIETQGFIFAHGGIPVDDMDRVEKLKPFKIMKYDAFMDKGLKFSKYVITGHWPTILYRIFPMCSPLYNHADHIVDIDGGCGVKEFGQLNALIVPNVYSQEFSYEMVDSFRTFTAKYPQEDNDARVNLVWGDNKVDIVTSGRKTSIVRRISDGATFEVPTSYVYNDGEDIRCEDFNNYLLPVQPGDKLKLVKEVPGFGRLVKRESTFGWYRQKTR